MNRLLACLLCFVLFFAVANAQYYSLDSSGAPVLNRKGASHFASLAMNCILQEFPNKTGHVQSDADDLKRPSDYHPAFYGCLDWHSAVHGHWMLIKLLKVFPDLPNAEKIRATISKNITAENIKVELAYFQKKYSGSYERTYGWAWLLKLAEELYDWDDVDGKRWAKLIDPLAKLIAQKYINYLPLQEYATRAGTHSNTAFGLSFALDYAQKTEHTKLETLLKERASFYFLNDKDCPASWEPGAADFFSPCLMEAELMSKVLSKNEYTNWLKEFLPKLSKGEPVNLFSSVRVSDRNDMQLVHLDGLNLSRAWCFLRIANKIDDISSQEQMRVAAIQDLNATLPQIADGDYAGEHWLASFAVYALSEQ